MKTEILKTLLVLLSFVLLCSQRAWAGPFEKGPVKQPETASPSVIHNTEGKKVFEEYFQQRKPEYEKYYLGDEITGFKLFDPKTGEVMLDAAMKDGVLTGELQGTARDKAKEEKSSFMSIVHADYVSADGSLIFKMSRIGDEIIGYSVIEDLGKPYSRRGLRNIALEKGRVGGSSRKIYSGDRPWKRYELNNEGDYREELFPQDDAYQERVFRGGMLAGESRKSRDSFLYGWYHRGRLGFWEKHLYRDEYAEKIEIYDEKDQLVDTVKTVFGESYEIKFENRDGKPIKIFRKTRGKKVIREVVREMEKDTETR